MRETWKGLGGNNRVILCAGSCGYKSDRFAAKKGWFPVGPMRRGGWFAHGQHAVLISYLIHGVYGVRLCHHSAGYVVGHCAHTGFCGCFW